MIDDLHYFAVEHGEVLFYAIIAGTEFLSQVYHRDDIFDIFDMFSGLR